MGTQEPPKGGIMECKYRRKWNLTAWKRKSEIKRPNKPKDKPKEKSMCKVCHEYPIAEGNRIMCRFCFKDANNVVFEENDLNLTQTGRINYE